MININDTVSLKRSIGLLKATTYVIGCMIGSGIFVSPVGVLLYSESVGSALLIWCGSAIIAFLGALCYAELGTTFPQSGSNYSYIRCIFGEFSAFIYLWMCVWVINPGYNAIVALVFANYVLVPLFPCSSVPSDAIRLVAALAFCLLTFVNCRSVNAAAKVQGVFTGANVFALVIIIAVGIYHMCNEHIENFEDVFRGTTKNPGNMAFALYSGLYAFGGWDFLNYVTEEVQNPHQTLLWVVYISIPFLTVIYLLVNMAYFAVLTTDEILSSSAVAVTFANRKLGGVSWFMPLCVAFSTFGCLNAQIFAGSRLYHVAAREGHLPGSFSMIHMQYCTPAISLVFQCLCSLAYLATTEIYLLINCCHFVMAVFESLVLGGMLWLRWKKPGLKRPIKIHLAVPILFFLVSIFLSIITCYQSPWMACIGIAVTLTGVPAYGVTVLWKDKPQFYKRAIGGITVFLQKSLLSVPAEKDE